MTKNIKDRLQKIDKDHFSLLTDIGKTAQEEKLKVYLVGGMVRDLLLDFDNLDIDIVVENNARHLAEVLVNKFPNCELSAKHDRFHTAKLIFTINNKKIPVDLASTREETYDHPAALPTVFVSDLKRDLIRRDFTINALAVSLLPHDVGEVVDLFGGLDDLKNKTVRILHDKSFIDDPTRMIRAVRFAVKLGFEIEPHTKELLDKAISSGQFDNLIEKIRGDRVKIEIRYLFNLSNIEEAVKAFFESGIYRMVSTELRYGELDEIIRKTQEFILTYKGNIRKWLIYLGIVLLKALLGTESGGDVVLNNLQLSSEEQAVVSKAGDAFIKLLSTQEGSPLYNNPVGIYKVLKDPWGLSIESIVIVRSLFFGELPVVNTEEYLNVVPLIDDYIKKTSNIELEISGNDLISMGVPQGKQIKEVLDKVIEAKINDPTMTKSDELKVAENFIKQLQK